MSPPCPAPQPCPACCHHDRSSIPGGRVNNAMENQAEEANDSQVCLLFSTSCCEATHLRAHCTASCARYSSRYLYPGQMQRTTTRALLHAQLAISKMAKITHPEERDCRWCRPCPPLQRPAPAEETKASPVVVEKASAFNATGRHILKAGILPITRHPRVGREERERAGQTAC